MTHPSSATADPAPLEAAPETTRLPLAQLLALTLAGFIAIMTETLPAGLLPQISAGLGISQSLAGQLVSVYALGSVLAAIPIVAATRSWSRRPLLLLAIVALLVFNGITALSSSYVVILGSRLVAGMAAGIVWGVLAGYARRLVPSAQQGRALAVVGVGQPIALCLGVPLGTWLGGLTDWRGVFWIMSALALVLAVWVRWGLPNFAGQPAERRQSLRAIFLLPGIRSVLAVILVWILAHNMLYTFIAPYLASVGLGERVDLVLLLFGASSILGVWATGLWVDRALRRVTLLSLAGFAIAALVLGLAGAHTSVVLAGVVLWGMTFGGAPTLLQTAIADTAGEAGDVAQSMLVTVFNLAVALGGIGGGVLLQQYGASALPAALLGLAVIGAAVVWRADRAGFTPGAR